MGIFIIVFENISFERNNSRNCIYLDIYVYIVNRRFMIWNGNYGWLSPAVSLAWQRLEAFQRCRQRNSCSDKNIGGMTMVFIGRNQRSHRDDKWERGRFLYLKRNGILRSYDISSNICFPAVWVCTFINRWEERVWGGIVNKGKIRRKSGCHDMKNFISFDASMSVYIATIKLCRSIKKK